MLLQYDVENNLSIKSKQRISFIADNKKELINSEMDVLDYKVLPVIVVYGKNASGNNNNRKNFIIKNIHFTIY